MKSWQVFFSTWVILFFLSKACSSTDRFSCGERERLSSPVSLSKDWSRVKHSPVGPSPVPPAWTPGISSSCQTQTNPHSRPPARTCEDNLDHMTETSAHYNEENREQVKLYSSYYQKRALQSESILGDYIISLHHFKFGTDGSRHAEFTLICDPRPLTYSYLHVPSWIIKRRVFSLDKDSWIFMRHWWVIAALECEETPHPDEDLNPEDENRTIFS